MKHRSRVGRRSIRKAAVVATLMAVLCAGQAGAQMIVSDPDNYAAKLQQIAKDAAEFGKNAQRWQETAGHYQQQLIKLQRLNFGQARMEDSFPPRPQDYGMEEMCPGPDRGLRDQLSSAFRQAMPKLDGNVVDEQQAICQRLVYAVNAKYNESVSMLRTLMQRSREFALIETQRDGVRNSPGALAANDNEAYRFVARNQLELDYWQARMKAYDDYVASLKWDQARLARRALQGKKGTLDGVVPSGVIKSALLK